MHEPQWLYECIQEDDGSQPAIWRIYTDDDPSYEATIGEFWSGEHDNEQLCKDICEAHNNDLNVAEQPTMRSALMFLFHHYRAKCEKLLSVDDIYVPKCDPQSLMNLCDEAIEGIYTKKYPLDKMHRWLGFIQGVLAATCVIDVDKEREFTRPLFHAVYGQVVPTFDSEASE